MTATATPTAHRTFAVLGTTDEVTECERCGRTDLKKTVVLDALDAEGNQTGSISHYGTDCGARAAGWTQAEVTAAAKEADDTAKEQRRIARQAEFDQHMDDFVNFIERKAGRKVGTYESHADVAMEAYGTATPYRGIKAARAEFEAA